MPGCCFSHSGTVDAHTAHHLFFECLKGDLMRGRTVILVSHHVQLCAPGANYIVALDNGHLQFQGNRDAFMSSGVLTSLSQTGATDPADEKEETAVPPVEEIAEAEKPSDSETSSTTGATVVEAETKPEAKKPPRRLVEEEKRAVGRISRDIWLTYLGACGGWIYWFIFALSLGLGASGPVLENWWLKCVLSMTCVQLLLITVGQGVVGIIARERERTRACVLHHVLCYCAFFSISEYCGGITHHLH